MKYVCINSFPRSGNTWMRSVFSHLLFDGSRDSIPDKYLVPNLDGPSHTHQGETIRLYKSHDRFLSNRAGANVIEHSFCIYIVRHPLDVFLSYLNFLTVLAARNADGGEKFWQLETGRMSAILRKGDLEYFFGVFLVFGTLQPAFRAAGSWQEHARYWLRPPIRTVRLRYEDLVAGDYSRLVEGASLFGKSKAEVERALRAAARDTRVDDELFWKQTPGLWKELLPEKHAARFFAANAALLEELGYGAGDGGRR